MECKVAKTQKQIGQYESIDLTRMECKDKMINMIKQDYYVSIDLTRMECKGQTKRPAIITKISIDLTRMECKGSSEAGSKRGCWYRFNQNGM